MVGKGEIADKKEKLLIKKLEILYRLLSVNAFNLDKAKVLLSGNGLK